MQFVKYQNETDIFNAQILKRQSMASLRQTAAALSAAAAFMAGLLFFGCDSRQPPPPVSVPEVAVVTVQPRAVVLTTELPGRTTAYRVAEIRPQVSGLLQKRLFTEGADVTAGQLLYQIDPEPFQAVLDRETANLAAMQKAAERARAALRAGTAEVARHQALSALAQNNRRRFEALVEDRAVSAIDRDRIATDAEVALAALQAAEAQVASERAAIVAAEAGIRQAEAALKAARINLDYTRITAPISGRIGRSGITEGAIVTAYQPVPLTTLQQLDPIYVDVTQSTTDVLALRQRITHGNLDPNGKNQNKVSILLEDGSAYPREGTFKFRDVTVDPTTGSLILRVVVPNPDNVLLPGMFVRAVMQEGVQEQAVFIPQQAVFRDVKGNPMALIVDAENQVQVRALTIDRAMGSQWLVASGLAAGDRVVVEGIQKVRPGTVVRAVPFEPGGDEDTTPSEKPSISAEKRSGGDG